MEDEGEMGGGRGKEILATPDMVSVRFHGPLHAEDIYQADW